MSRKNAEEMSFLDHLEELRWRLVKGALAVVVFAIPCWIYWREIFDVLLVFPIRSIEPRPHLIYTAPHQAVMLSLKIAIFGGILGAIPVLFYQLWRFVAPGLYKRERRIALPLAVISTFCFLLGIGFCYLLVPYMMNFMIQFGAERMEAMLDTGQYIGFILKLCLAFGLIFELPVVSFILTRAGVLEPAFLVRQMRWALVIIFIVAAILSPPDVISQMFFAIPLLVLYGISILVSFVAAKRK